MTSNIVLFSIFLYLLIGFANGLYGHCKLPNEIFDRCRGRCGKRCDDLNPPCPKLCIPGCICKDGYLRDLVTGLCVLPENCPKPINCTKPNEVYSPCNSHCDEFCFGINPFCSHGCVPGCACKKGYARDTFTGQCVDRKDCMNSNGRICPRENEIYHECFGHCDKTCFNRNPACEAICLPGCICKEGYLRDTNTGNCVPENKCPRPQLCPKRNEIFDECSARCQLNCDGTPIVCPAICEPGCICRRGFLRNRHGRCVHPLMC